jgi:hypothetical protein
MPHFFKAIPTTSIISIFHAKEYTNFVPMLQK